MYCCDLLRWLHSISVLCIITLIFYLMFISITTKLDDCGSIQVDCFGYTETKYNFDWLGLGQYLIVIFLWFAILGVYITTLGRYRKSLLVGFSLLYIYITQIFLLELSDNDRRNQYRIVQRIQRQLISSEEPTEDGEKQPSNVSELRNYFLLYTTDTTLNITFKIVLIVFLALELVILRLIYASDRYSFLLSALRNTPKRRKAASKSEKAV